MKTPFIKIFFLVFIPVIFFGFTGHEKHKQSTPPNIVLIIVDDLGYSDLASYGNTNIHTPNIDALGNQGTRFTQAYVTSPVCSPSRMGIMTGRYQNRFGSEFMPYDKFDPGFIRNMRKNYLPLANKNESLRSLHPSLALNRKKYQTGLSLQEITLAELLKKNGYATGLVGKWNLGDEEGDHPYERGFDYSYYFSGALSRYVDVPFDNDRYIDQHLPWAFSELPAWTPRAGSSAIHEGKSAVVDTSYLTFSFAKKGIEFIGKNKAHPFFLTLSFNAPHDPFQVPKEYFDRVQNVQDSVKRVYYGMIEALDEAVGQVKERLRSDGIANNTVIFFVSDNGGAAYTRATDNAPLRGGKCTHFEGGLLVPFFINYPGTKNGNFVYDKPVSSLDIFSTIASITKTNLPMDRVYDGVDLLPYLTDNKKDPHEILYWRNGYSKAIRKGNWKLYINEKSKSKYLFNLETDREELHDLLSSQPAIADQLMKELTNWEKTQTINPAWPSMANILIDVRGKKYFFPG
jgi:arylsulfatase A-like enzyme